MSIGVASLWPTSVVVFTVVCTHVVDYTRADYFAESNGQIVFAAQQQEVLVATKATEAFVQILNYINALIRMFLITI